MRRYSKPHLPYDQQLQRMAERGMQYSDRGIALRALKRIGYYRLSAYSYPFRAPLDPARPRGGIDGRSDSFLEGTSFSDVLALYEFDQKLRRCLQDGLECLEVGLAVQIGYVAGKRDPFVHLMKEHLDESACSAVDKDDPAATVYESWLRRYDKHLHDARNEDFVKHFLLNYDGDLPIWAATETLSFGSLVRLYSLLHATDRKKIADLLGIRDGKLLHGWLLSLNVLRNHCAHHGRVWNRVMAYPPGRMKPNLVGEKVRHLTELTEANRSKLYFMAALLAYFVLQIDPDSPWPRSFATLMKKFPIAHGLTAHNSMGFPEGWAEEPLWNPTPPPARA
ncbi:Abi family protein [Arthrobacter sp. RIT-PI-e]|uniref:Abi family protein n=1 Tax=Arthrobacter sp. RIT-PI-e TaxID=1681197 RepID=UPI0009E439DB|nr:Abi family protein [Arthrobacter sp. RIT-PI-e]